MVAPNGRFTIPVGMRMALGLEDGGEVVGVVRNGQLVLEATEAAFARIQATLAACAGEKSRDDEGGQ
jgi:bifunctional DNA-binding transcriptional regulator/antitoxin component of YhaV-PrlF toxin-antitoxin module